MNFDNAKKGIKTVYNAEILSIVASIIAIVAAVILLVLGSIVKDGQVNTSDVISTISLIVAGIIGLVAYIMNIVGISSASKDNADFKNALYMTLGAIVVSIASTLLEKKMPGLSRSLKVSENIFELLVAYYVIIGCTGIAKQVGNAAVEAEGKKTMKFFLTVWIIGVVVEVIGKVVEIFSKSTALTVVAGLLGLAALVLSLVCYFAYLKLLRKTLDILN